MIIIRETPRIVTFQARLDWRDNHLLRLQKTQITLFSLSLLLLLAFVIALFNNGPDATIPQFPGIN